MKTKRMYYVEFHWVTFNGETFPMFMRTDIPTYEEAVEFAKNRTEDGKVGWEDIKVKEA